MSKTEIVLWTVWVVTPYLTPGVRGGGQNWVNVFHAKFIKHKL